MLLDKLRVAVVGGSIAGHLNALSLMRHGASVTVFERSSKNSFTDRGVGIGVPTAVVNAVKELGYFSDNVKHDNCPEFKRIVPSSEYPREGKLLWLQPVPFELMSWSEIFNQFNGQIPEENIHYNAKVVEVGMIGDKAFVLLQDDGVKQEFDLVIGADGYLSTARKFVSPTSSPAFAGYVLWRGGIPEADLVAMNLVTPSHEGFSVVFLPDCGGHLAMFFVRKPSGERVLTWGVYIPVPEADFLHVMTDKDGQVHTHSIPPGMVQPALEKEWKDRALANMPSDYSSIIAASEDTFIQGIFDMEVSSLVRNCVVLSGDSGFVARPHSVAGFAKAFENSTTLVTALQNCPGVESALAEYNDSQLAIMHKAVVLGEQLGKGTVLEVPGDMTDWDEDRFKNWMSTLTNVDGKLNMLSAAGLKKK